MDYRPPPDDHEDAFFDVIRYAFSPEDGPEWDREDGPDDHLFEPRALYDADPETPDADLDPGAIRATCGILDLTLRVRDGWHRAGGVSVVASPPETRRRGHVRDLMVHLLEELRAEGYPLSVLWPFDYGFYRRLGWDVVGQRTTTEVEPGDLADVAAEPAGEFRRLDADAWEALDDVYDAWATEAFAMRRDEDWWRNRVFDPFWGTPYVYGWADDDGDLRAYLVYLVRDEDDETVLNVGDFAFVDEAARRQLWRFCHDHDSQVESVRVRGPVEPHLLETLGDPGAPDVELVPGAMVRLVDVPRSVEALAVPDDASGRVVVDVADEHCDWNNGRFELDFDAGAATCEPTDADPDIEADVGSLAQLVVGAVPPDRLAAHGHLVVHDDAALETLLAAYPEDECYLREGF